ncbi:MAG: hypothetical protein SOV85_15975 [Clostridium sp.]|uniref:hypothetical protein n=1 Tax=Clostridium sp. TaxID=1506 RepID=UPI002A756F39|nr:hypothetical protein [Clostridium sp.]MDY2632821.1 hypothetical protein [Clostridium sp.]
MYNDCCFEDELEYKSLVFNGGSMNYAEETEPDTVPLGSANSALRIMGWLLPQGDTEEYTLTFNVPKDAANSSRRTKVFVHLLTDNSNTPMGNRFAIRLSSLFARANGVVNIANLRTINKRNIPIKNSPGNFQYNHYVIEFELNDVVRAEDFALLSVARIASNNDYAGALLLTSIEFRYLSC